VKSKLAFFVKSLQKRSMWQTKISLKDQSETFFFIRLIKPKIIYIMLIKCEIYLLKLSYQLREAKSVSLCH
jgi:capsule polysaccharide export protein KpsE/RkpR